MTQTEIQIWTEFSRDLKRRVRWDGEKIEGALTVALKTLPLLEGREREELLRMGRVVAERSSKLGAAFLRVAPQALSSLPPPAEGHFFAGPWCSPLTPGRPSSIFWKRAETS